MLLPLSWLFMLFSSLRRLFYASGVLRVRKANLPVVVVGNITAGGTGKTPVVAWLAAELRGQGYRPAIISRGYGGRVGGQPRQVEAHSDPAVCGDEPVMLARLTGLPVVVCGDRLAAAELAGQLGANVAIADDGLQHYRLHRDVEIAVVDGMRWFGNGRRLPAGPLRESIRRLGRVDAVLINGATADYGQRFDLHAEQARLLDGDAVCSLEEFAGREVWAVAGIGNPARFFTDLRSRGIRAREVALDDHGRVDLDELQRQAQIPVLMTEKDAVKCTNTVGTDVWSVPVVMQIEDSDARIVLDRVLDKLPPVDK